MLYTALTRCKSAEGLFLQGFKPESLKANVDGMNEINRIRQCSLVKKNYKRLNFFLDYPPENWDYVCLQNVRSLGFHKDDILDDPICMSAKIVCMTETAINDPSWSGWNEFSHFNVYHKMRKECIGQIDNEHRKSGGVAVLIRNDMPSGLVENLKQSKLEIVTASAGLSDKESVLVTGIYKDHKMSRPTFLEEMNCIFQTQNNGHSIILGDFNLHDENGSSNLKLNEIAQKHDFSPMVHEGTTINGHILDQIYVTDSLKKEMEIVVLHSYFSDHNLIVLCMKKNQLS